jgi:hypothetical protein
MAINLRILFRIKEHDKVRGTKNLDLERLVFGGV